MKNKKVIEIYDQIAEDYASTYDKIDSPEDLVFLDAFLKHLKSGSDVLDLGCGTGFSAGYFQKQGMIAQGVDLSSSMIAIARRNYPDIPFVLQDMRTFVPGKMVDAVWAGYCLFHLEQMDCEATIKKIRKYLKPGGIFGLVLQEGAGEIEPFDPFLPIERIYVHLYTKNEIESILKKYGFTVIEHSIKPLMDEKEFGYNKLLLIAK
ncbi:MAG: methyltransferase domain-containing protein [Patescibacteria group bacterium]